LKIGDHLGERMRTASRTQYDMNFQPVIEPEGFR